MSAYVTLTTPIVDRECLLLALADLGFTSDRVEVHADSVPLVGYEGGRRQQRAHVVIPRRHVGRAANDIGFEWTPTGFQAHVSDYDRRRYGAGWLGQLRARYQHHDAAKRERLVQARNAEIEARRLAEIELRRREEERQRLVEAQRQAVHEKARAMGYRIEESRQGDSLRLVLVKRVY